MPITRILVAEATLLGELLAWRLGQLLGPEVTHVHRVLSHEELTKIDTQQFDLVIVDPALPYGSALGWLQNGHPVHKTVVLTDTLKDFPMSRLFQTEVAAIIHKADQEEFLGNALRTVLSGGTALVSQRIRTLRSNLLSDPNYFGKILSPQEQNVLGRIGRGSTAEEIAQDLGIAHETVLDHRKSLLRKLGLNKQTALVAYAYRKGFAEPFLCKTGI